MLRLQGMSFAVAEDGHQKQIIQNVSLRVKENQLVAVTGPNGGGKSTLARLIAGIETPTAGRLFFQGQDITDLSITDRARLGIAYALQQPVRFKGIRVLDLLRIASGKPLTTAGACEYLAAVGLCAREYIHREVNASLSGGELKRIEIATVLARGAALSVFDEPEAGIDLWSFQNLIEVFENMRRTVKNSSLIIISHQERILNIADEIVVLKEGGVALQGPRDQVLPQLVGTPAAVTECRAILQGKGGERA